MTGSLLLFVKLFVAVLPFSCLCILYYYVNLNHQIRGRQFASVIFGGVYAIVAAILYSRIFQASLRFINHLAENYLKKAAENPAKAQHYKELAASIKGVDWNIYLFFILNAAIFLVFIILKTILLPVMKRIWANDDVFAFTSGVVYDWDDEISMFFLKSDLYFVKKLFKLYFMIVCVAVCLLSLFSKMYADSEVFLTRIYPFLSVILVGEVFFFTDGITKEEYRADFDGDAGSSTTVATYYPIKRYLQNILGEYVIGNKTRFPRFLSLHSNSEVISKFDKIHSQEGRLATIFFTRKATSRNKMRGEMQEFSSTKRLKGTVKEGIEVDEALADATYKLLNGESVLFSSPFYHDYSDYIFLPLNRALTKGSKVLVIVCRNGVENHIKKWFESSLDKTIHVPNMWNVDFLNDYTAFEGEVGIIHAAGVMNPEILRLNRDFLRSVTQVVMVEPSVFISTAQISLSVFVSAVSKDAVYYILDRNTDGLVDTMSHILKKSIVDVTPTVSPRNISTYMAWRAESENISNHLFPSVARYLGIGTELIAAALRQQVGKGEWLSFTKFPVLEMKWISQQYYKVLCDYASIPISNEELESRMLFNNDLWGVKKQDFQYLVVEDEFCNLFEIERQFESRANQEAFINVISSNYLLREYMYMNPVLFENDPKAIPSLTADYVRSKRNIAIELLLKLNADFVKENEIVKTLRYMGSDSFFGEYSSYEVKSALFNLILTYFDSLSGMSPESFVDQRDKYYKLHLPKKENKQFRVISKILSDLKPVYYILEDEADRTNYLESKLYGQVYQSHLPGQHIIIDGRYYEILYIGDNRGVILKRAGDHILAREYYRQLRRYTIESFTTDDEIGKVSSYGKLRLEEGVADFRVETDGYLTMLDYGDFREKCFKREINDIPERSYKTKSMLRLTLPDSTREERQTIAFILNELFRTLYPSDCDFLCALTDCDDMVIEGALYRLNAAKNASKDCIYIVEDSVLDMGLLASFKRNFMRIFEIVTDYLDWHAQMISFTPAPKPTLENMIDVHSIMASSEKKSEKKGVGRWLSMKIKTKKPAAQQEEKKPSEPPRLPPPSEETPPSDSDGKKDDDGSQNDSIEKEK